MKGCFTPGEMTPRPCMCTNLLNYAQYVLGGILMPFIVHSPHFNFCFFYYYLIIITIGFDAHTYGCNVILCYAGMEDWIWVCYAYIGKLLIDLITEEKKRISLYFGNYIPLYFILCATFILVYILNENWMKI